MTPTPGRPTASRSSRRRETLSPQQQAIQNQNKGAQLNLATIANNQSGFLKDYLGKPADTSSAPGLISNPNLQTTIGGGYDTNFDRTYAGADDFSADRQRVEDALWQRGASGRAQEEEGLRTRLLNSGLREGSAAWNAEMERLGRQVADERTGVLLAGGQEQSRMVGLARDAAQFASGQQQAQNAAAAGQAQFGNNAALQGGQFQNQARSQALSEAYAARNQPINEISALLSGSQVTQPNFVNANMPTIPTTDVAGIINQNYQNQLLQNQANSAGGLISGLGSGIGSLLSAPSSSVFGSMIGLSDERAKTDKKKVGERQGNGALRVPLQGRAQEPAQACRPDGAGSREEEARRRHDRQGRAEACPLRQGPRPDGSVTDGFHLRRELR